MRVKSKHELTLYLLSGGRQRENKKYREEEKKKKEPMQYDSCCAICLYSSNLTCKCVSFNANKDTGSWSDVVVFAAQHVRAVQAVYRISVYAFACICCTPSICGLKSGFVKIIVQNLPPSLFPLKVGALLLRLTRLQQFVFLWNLKWWRSNTVDYVSNALHFAKLCATTAARPKALILSIYVR